MRLILASGNCFPVPKTMGGQGRATNLVLHQISKFQVLASSKITRTSPDSGLCTVTPPLLESFSELSGREGERASERARDREERGGAGFQKCDAKVATAATFDVKQISRFGREGTGRKGAVATSDEPATAGSTVAWLRRVQGRNILDARWSGACEEGV